MVDTVSAHPLRTHGTLGAMETSKIDEQTPIGLGLAFNVLIFLLGCVVSYITSSWRADRRHASALAKVRRDMEAEMEKAVNDERLRHQDLEKRVRALERAYDRAGLDGGRRDD